VRAQLTSVSAASMGVSVSVTVSVSVSGQDWWAWTGKVQVPVWNHLIRGSRKSDSWLTSR